MLFRSIVSLIFCITLPIAIGLYWIVGSVIMIISQLIVRDGAFSHIAIRDVLDKYRYLPKQDRAFITRLSQGTIERMIELDAIINQFSKTKVKKMKPVIAAILRSGVYQLKYMDSVPDSAACNEAVKLTVKRGFGGLNKMFCYF